MSSDKKLDDIRSTTSEMKAELVALHGEYETSTAKAAHNEFIRWLEAPDVTLAHEAAFQKHLKSTGEWFTQGDIFKDWLSTCGKPLILYGMPGCGKTVLR